jgi:hypothetical protein
VEKWPLVALLLLGLLFTTPTAVLQLAGPDSPEPVAWDDASMVVNVWVPQE